MEVTENIHSYIDSLPEPKRSDVRRLHELILELSAGSRLWFLDGKDATGKVVSNPSIGYGVFEKGRASGKAQEFYRIGISANSAGLTVYIMSISDRTYLKETYGSAIGKAEITGYCIKFRSLKNVDVEVLKQAIRDGLQRTRA